VPTDIAIVELNRLVVFQKFINLAYVEVLKKQLSQMPSLESVFRFALPLQPEHPQFQMMQNAQNMYTLISTSTDFRFLEAQVLKPQDVPSFESTGRPVVILGLAVGYGSNFLNVLHVENRLVLANGSHRAYALRELGINEIPCLVQRITRRDELDLVASGDLASHPDRYLKSTRPPMLRDYFDPALRKIA
jgi:ParB-like nuclease domain